MSMFHRDSLSRRQFLAGCGATAAAAAAGASVVHAGPTRSTVVVVRDKARKCVNGFEADAAAVRRMVDKAVMTLAEKDSIPAAWGKFVTPKDRVAVKFNGLFKGGSTHPEVVKAVTDGLVEAGVKAENITVYDRDSRDIKKARMEPNTGATGVRITATDGRYGGKHKAGPIQTQLTELLAEADVLINLPIMKTHSKAGITGALKNHLGTVPNAGAFHAKDCAYIADLNALSPIKDKTRICICDALYGVFNQGPQYRPKYRWDYYGIAASVDPVSLDAVLDDILRAKRIEEGLTPRNNSIIHIERAAELGVGIADLGNIKRVELEV